MVIGTVEYRFEEYVIPAPNTTPDALVIHRLARQALDLGATAMALEVSSHALSLWRVAGVSFDAVGFTSWGRDHLDFHGTLEAYRDAKGMLFDICLKRSLAQGKTPIAVAHHDEPGLDMLSRTPVDVRCVRCEVGAQSDTDRHPVFDANLDQLRLHIEGTPSARGVTLAGTWISGTTLTPLTARALPLIGDYHPSNLAIALGMTLGTHPQHAASLWESLTHTRGVPGRMERVILAPDVEERAQGRVALIDYAHTPDAITRALEALRAVHSGAVHVVIGCGGNRDRGKRPEMTRAALMNADVVWLTSDNPRDEEPEQIIADALLLGSEWTSRVAEVRTVLDRRTCLERAWRELPSQGALLVTGKGHEDYQEVGERRFRLLDAEAVRAAAWSHDRQIALDDVPLAVSMTTDWSSLDPLRRLISLFTEAQGRSGGLTLTLVSHDQIEPITSRYSSIAHQTETLILPIRAQSEPISESLSTSDLFEDLWSSLHVRLTPRIRHIIWVAESPDQFAILSKSAHHIAQLICTTPPYPTFTVTTALPQSEQQITLASTQGGWPKLRRGPKIPSLIT